jgi:hypothetical protein
MAYWMVACSVFLYIAIFGTNIRICRIPWRTARMTWLVAVPRRRLVKHFTKGFRGNVSRKRTYLGRHPVLPPVGE